MNKKISLLMAAVLLALFAACGRSDTKNVTINGELPDTEFEGAPVYLMELGSEGPSDSTFVKEGKFQFKKSFLQETMCQIYTRPAESGMQYRSLVVLEAGKVFINIKTDSLSGTPLNDYYYQNVTSDAKTKQLNEQRQECLNQYYAAEDAQGQQEAANRYNQIDSAYSAEMLGICRRMYQANNTNVLGAFALTQIADLAQLSYDSIEAMLANAPEVVSEFAPLRKIRTRLFHVSNTSEGNRFTDIEGIDFASGNPINLSDMIDTDQITLIDFWASWCSPCRHEITTNLNRLYEAYKDKGLNIIGIDVWDKIDDHKAAVEKLEIQYPQLIDTTRVATENYGVEGIPTILLLDKDGKIYRRGIRGEEIEAAILELLNGKAEEPAKK